MINEQLKQLYSNKWNTYSTELTNIVKDEAQKIKPTNPLLVYINNEQEYQNADIRIMIVGQETNDWDGNFHGNIASIYGCYKSFDISKYKGVFTNHYNLFISKIKHQFPSKSVVCIWNNIIKTGKANAKGFPSQEIYACEKEHFLVFEQEIEIIKPNLILFYTGPYYDIYIRERLPNVVFESVNSFKNNQLVRLKIPGVNFAFRTYHPNYLNRNRNGLQSESVYKQILSELSF